MMPCIGTYVCVNVREANMCMFKTSFREEKGDGCYLIAKKFIPSNKSTHRVEQWWTSEIMHKARPHRT